MPPKFAAAAAPKCKRCNLSVYPMERVDYDAGTYHQLCFKCLNCKSTLQMTSVAMIKGDLYCKNCFKRIFYEKGRYSSFDDKHNEQSPTDGPSAESSTNVTPRPVTIVSPPEPTLKKIPEAVPTPAAEPAAQLPVLSVAARRGSFEKPGAPVACAQPKAEPNSPVSDYALLNDAISRKDLTSIHSLLDLKGSSLIFAKNEKGQTLLESTLNDYRHKAMSQELVKWLHNKIDAVSQLCEKHSLISPFSGSESPVSQNGSNGATSNGTIDSSPVNEPNASADPLAN